MLDLDLATFGGWGRSNPVPMIFKTKTKIAQLRLLLPESWIPELDNLAASRFLTRLGLIRFYLRAQMNEDLANLAEHFDRQKEQRKTHQRLADKLQDYQR